MEMSRCSAELVQVVDQRQCVQ